MDLLSPPADFQMNQYTTTPCDSRTYDNNGNLLSSSSTAGAMTFVYDYADRLVLVQAAVADGTGGITLIPVASYTYDALSRRTSKTVYSGGLPPSTRRYCYDGSCVIEERQNNEVVQSFVHASGLTDQIRENDTVVFEMRQGTQEYFFHTDDQGNVLALTSAQGSVVERYDYDDYGAVTFLTSDGAPTSGTSSGVGNPYCWGGLRLDAETGLQNDDGGGYFETQSGRSVNLADGESGVVSKHYITIPHDLPTRGPGNNPWSGGGGTEMKTGVVKFFNEAKGFGMVVGGSGKTHTKTGHVTLLK
jgi:YD repeat-containing protein